MRFVTLSSEIFARFFSIVSVTSPTIAGSLVTLSFENDRTCREPQAPLQGALSALHAGTLLVKSNNHKH